MDMSSRTPRGVPNRCPICGEAVVIAPAEDESDAVRARCGHLRWRKDEEAREVLTVRLGPGESRVDELNEVDPTREEIHRLHEQVAHMSVVPHILLDFASVGLVSSKALGELIILDRVIKVASGRLRLCNVGPQVEEVFRVMGLDELFDFQQA